MSVRCSQTSDLLLQLSDVNDQVTALSGTLAAERTKGEVASAELDQLRKERKEKDSIMKQQQVRG